VIGDAIHIKTEYYQTADSIVDILDISGDDRKVLLVGGESGSGKSVTAMCLQQRLHLKGLLALVLHQDDYFHLPPKTNHEKRLNDIQWVGLQEVKMDLLQIHLNMFLDNRPTLTKPLVNYRTNEILEENIPLSAYRIMIIEGTYVLQLHDAHTGIFMDRDYRQTRAQRLSRNREPYDEFIEQVLQIEHTIIRSLRPRAQILVNPDYSVTLQHTAHD
jgi:uridine kinase